MKEKISVITPVYNTKEYLEDCVNSVLKQTCTDFKLILIDDGSRDGSKEICEKFAGQDKRIQVICQEHKGVSAARNAGIEAAEGKYLFFLDSDDRIHSQLLEALYQLLEENHGTIGAAGMCHAERERCGENTDWEKEDRQMWEGGYLLPYKVKEKFFFGNTKVRFDAIGGKMILRNAVKAVRFQEKLTHGEDTYFLYQIIANGADAVVLPRNWYYYRKNNEKKYSVQSCRSRYQCQKAICDCETENGRITEAVYAEWRLLCNMVLWQEIGRQYRDNELEEYVKSLINTEKKTELFSKIDWCRKAIFYLGCVYYPLYKWIADAMYWYHVTLGN